MNRTRRTGTMRKDARSRGIRYCSGEQARGLRESPAKGRRVLLEWLCVVVAGGYPGPWRIGRLILKRSEKKPDQFTGMSGIALFFLALLRTGTRRSPVEHAKPSAMRPRLAMTSNISLSRACSSALSGFEQLARMELSRAEYFCSTSGIDMRKC